VDLRPNLLLEVGRSEGVAPRMSSDQNQDFERVVRLHALLHSINTALCRQVPGGSRPAFVVTNEVLKYYPLVRPSASEADLHIAVDHLAKVIYEGGRQRRPGSAESPEEWRLPEGAARDEFRQSYGLQALVFLRNYFDHDERNGAGSDKRSRREGDVGDFYQAACGARMPTTAEDFSKARTFLLVNLLASLERLEACVRSDASPAP
jgi:hypothetical protein